MLAMSTAAAPTCIQEKKPRFDLLRRTVIAIQLVLLAVLILGRAVSAIGDTHFSHTRVVTPAVLQVPPSAI